VTWNVATGIASSDLMWSEPSFEKLYFLLPQSYIYIRTSISHTHTQTKLGNHCKNLSRNLQVEGTYYPPSLKKVFM